MMSDQHRVQLPRRSTLSNSPSPMSIAATLAALVDTLIPGDDRFPPATLAGTHGLVFNRVRERRGNAALAQLSAELNRYGDFVTAYSPEKIVIVRRFEEEEPELFAFLRFATYLSYYETPPVISALQALGHDYNDAPQPLGYDMPPFDYEIHVPANPRGFYKKTAEVRRIDLTELADLGLPKSEV
jgi:hypothetical protein